MEPDVPLSATHRPSWRFGQQQMQLVFRKSEHRGQPRSRTIKIAVSARRFSKLNQDDSCAQVRHVHRAHGQLRIRVSPVLPHHLRGRAQRVRRPLRIVDQDVEHPSHLDADASRTRRDQGGAEPNASRAGARTGALAVAGGARLSRVPRRADQFAKDHVLQISRHVALATRALAPKPEGPRHVGADWTDRRALAPTRQDQPSLAAIPLPRQTPEVGAECVSSARSALSGGRRVKPASLPGWGVRH